MDRDPSGLHQHVMLAYQRNDVGRPAGRFATNLVRITFARMFDLLH